MRRVLSCLAVVAASFLLANTANGQTLSITGPCPGVRTATVTGVSPFAPVYFLRAFGTGSAVIPTNFICAGTVLGLNNTAVFAGLTTADAFGNATMTAFVPRQGCSGLVWIQAFDGSTCLTTNVVPL
ncbi:MAG: hypothetical protein ACF8PN_04040 [Phycisphaerales bacterium]